MLVLQAGEEYRYSQAAESVMCMPRDVLKDSSSHSGSFFSDPAQRDPVMCAPILHSQLNNRLDSEDRLKAMPLRNLPHQGSSLMNTQGFHYLRNAIPSLQLKGGQSPYAQMKSSCSSDNGIHHSLKGQHVSLAYIKDEAKKSWNFEVVASLRTKPCSLASDVIAAIDFDETGSLFATGGIARKIRVCSYASVTNLEEQEEEVEHDQDDDFEDERRTGPHGSMKKRHSRKRKRIEASGIVVQNHDEAASRIICTPAKLSSLKWRPLGSNVIGCGDYDGVVTEWDVEQGLCLCERYEHSGQRLWSVDYSSWFPTLCASASSDGRVRLWTQNCDRSVGVIRSPGRNSICCAEFNSTGSHQIAVACADSNIYLYDLRRLDTSLLCLRGHSRAASYARYLNENELVSASIDSTVKLWDVSNVTLATSWRRDTLSTMDGRGGGTVKTGEGRLSMTFDSHRNVKNFVGLSVSKNGLISCGSESNEVFVYDKSHSNPIWKMKFPPTTERRIGIGLSRQNQGDEGADELGLQERGTSFVGAVCWRDQRDHQALVTANSQGTVQVIKVCC